MGWGLEPPIKGPLLHHNTALVSCKIAYILRTYRIPVTGVSTLYNHGSVNVCLTKFPGIDRVH